MNTVVSLTPDSHLSHPSQPGWRPPLSRLLASLTLVTLLAYALPAQAVTILPSANGLNWDIDDANGEIDDGGQDAFDDFGRIHIRVLDVSNTILTDNEVILPLNLADDGPGRLSTTTPVTASEVEVSRALFAPNGTDYLRYIDTFTNVGSDHRRVLVAWGGGLGSDSCTTVAATSSGDLTLSSADVWAVTIEARESGACTFDPNGPAIDPPVGVVLGSPQNGVLDRLGATFPIDSNPFTTPWSGNGADGPFYIYSFTLAPGESVSLAYFVYRGLSETKSIPPATGQIDLARTTVAGLVANPDFDDLTLDERAAIRNWFSPFQSFTITSAGVRFNNNPNRERFTVQGTLTLVPANDGIDPALEPVTIRVGTAVLTIPSGSFGATTRGGFAFNGPVNGVDVVMRIAPNGLDTFNFGIQATKVDLTDTANPMDIALTIGNDGGVTNLRFQGLLSFP